MLAHSEGGLVLIYGIKNAQHRFYFVSVSLVSHERINTYLHLFMAPMEAHEKESSSKLDPSFVIVDGYIVIYSYYEDSVSKVSIGMCWAHIVRNVDKKLLGSRMRRGGRGLGGSPRSCCCEGGP